MEEGQGARARPQKPQDRVRDPQGRRAVLFGQALGIQVFLAFSSRYHLAAAVMEGTPPHCLTPPAFRVLKLFLKWGHLPPPLPRPPSWELMNLRTWAGLGLAELSLTLAQGLDFPSKSMGLAVLQRDN